MSSGKWRPFCLGLNEFTIFPGHLQGSLYHKPTVDRHHIEAIEIVFRHQALDACHLCYHGRLHSEAGTK